jgi:glycosyltransferase involved in cell wall biosynthesis
MDLNKIILIGADPLECTSLHPGGVLTMSISLIEYAKKNGYQIEIINTARSGFIYVSPFNKIIKTLNRIVKLTGLLRNHNYHGVLIFSGAGLSFYEKIIFSGICKIFKVKDLFIIVDSLIIDNNQENFLKRILIRLLLRVPYKLAASGQKWCQFFEECGVRKSRIVLAHYWLPESFQTATNPKETIGNRLPHFVFVGWMIEEKGIREILVAIEELRKNYSFFFTFIGGGPLLSVVQEKIMSSNWMQQVSATGWLTGEDLDHALNSKDIFVLPSGREGFPMSLIAAFSKGLPAICSDIGGISDSLYDELNGFLIEPRDSTSLIKAMEKYLKNPKLITLHSSAALNIFKKNHNPDTNCSLYFDALK